VVDDHDQRREAVVATVGASGTGSNPLNIVANFGLEGGGIVNFVGSYRFEMKFKAPFARANGPSAPAAMPSGNGARAARPTLKWRACIASSRRP
jgi:hypothetical protein